MAQDFEFAQFGKTRNIIAHQVLGNPIPGSSVLGGPVDTTPPGRTAFK